MASLPKVASSSAASVATDIRPVAGARNIATPGGSAVQASAAVDPTFSDGPGFFFRPAPRPDVGDHGDRRPAPTLSSRFSPTTSAVTAAINTERSAEIEREDARRQRSAARPALGEAAQATSLYRQAAGYLGGESNGRGGSLNQTT